MDQMRLRTTAIDQYLGYDDVGLGHDWIEFDEAERAEGSRRTQGVRRR
jgi:hypothetical protein